jgi:hypothetical protein
LSTPFNSLTREVGGIINSFESNLDAIDDLALVGVEKARKDDAIPALFSTSLLFDGLFKDIA